MEVLHSIPQLESLRDQWNALADAHGHALLRHEWFLSAAKTLHEERDLAVVIRTRDNRLEGVAPLVQTSRAGVGRLEFLGARTLYEPSGFLACDEPTRTAVLEDVVRQRRPLLLQRLATAADVTGLERAARGHGVLACRRSTASLGVALDGENATRAAAPTGKLRSDLKRARARAAEYGALSFEAVVPGAADLESTFEAFMAVEASGWKSRAGSALAASEQMQAFFRTYCRLAAEARILRFFFLRLGSRVAAAQLAVEVYDRLWLLKIGFDESVARCSPGFLLVAESLAYAQARGLQSYEFLGGAESWEQRWRPAIRPCSAAIFYPWSLRGGLSASVDAVGAAWRRLRTHGRPRRAVGHD